MSPRFTENGGERPAVVPFSFANVLHSVSVAELKAADTYAPDRYYDGRFGEADFQHHY